MGAICGGWEVTRAHSHSVLQTTLGRSLLFPYPEVSICAYRARWAASAAIAISIIVSKNSSV